MQSPTIIGKLTLGEKLQGFKPAFSAWAGVVGVVIEFGRKKSSEKVRVSKMLWKSLKWSPYKIVEM